MGHCPNDCVNGGDDAIGYVYDNNGNVTLDKKTIIKYNLLNFPDTSSYTIPHEIGHTFQLDDNFPDSNRGLMGYP
ncbi:hypothetical protein [uncultured Bacteroides sp.]|uniref:hypothetical protein n=1 Tax=uncultured Bacteroides sp. TaxID=162156 RepID=UPI002AAC487E|nr:hypothetical protein [uncultured Bacteroides sp.]